MLAFVPSAELLHEQLLERVTLAFGAIVSTVAWLGRSAMSAEAALVLGSRRALARRRLVLVEADGAEGGPAIELLLVHILSVLGVAALVLLVSWPFPEATALSCSMLGVRAMIRASARGGCIDADDLRGVGRLALKNLGFDPCGEGCDEVRQRLHAGALGRFFDLVNENVRRKPVVVGCTPVLYLSEELGPALAFGCEAPWVCFEHGPECVRVVQPGSDSSQRRV